jgi:hypothetical protein
LAACCGRTGRPISGVRPIRYTLLALAACSGAAGPPRGPAHTPVHSPEAKSLCPEQWKAAKTAREALLGLEGPAEDRALEAAARAVLSQAACERAGFERMTVEAGVQQIVAAELRGVRRQYQAARNLYEEAAGYEVGRLRVVALAHLAELHLGFARKLADLPPPSDVVDPAERIEVAQEMRQLASSFEALAVLAATRALDLMGAEVPEDAETRRAVDSACQLLAALEPGGAQVPACGDRDG